MPAHPDRDRPRERQGDLLEIVRCPGCHARLEALAGAGLRCSECEAVYPVFDGMPWLYRDVPGSCVQWAGTLQLFRSELLADHAKLEAAEQVQGLLPATRDRLARQRAGLERWGRQVFELLECFASSTPRRAGHCPRSASRGGSTCRAISTRPFGIGIGAKRKFRRPWTRLSPCSTVWVKRRLPSFLVAGAVASAMSSPAAAMGELSFNST
ncbi:MAG: hypothetical protein CL933_12605 [Deltaproteobacteria bacterium]|nr:hypothetical protein [Deltaproteobacteria bacterium]